IIYVRLCVADQRESLPRSRLARFKLHGSFWRSPETHRVWGDGRHCELPLWSSDVRRHPGSRPFDDAGCGRVIDSDHHLQSFPDSFDSGLYEMTAPILEVKNVVKYYGG